MARWVWRYAWEVATGEVRNLLCDDGCTRVRVYVYVQRAEISRQSRQEVTDGLLRPTSSERRRSNPAVSTCRFSQGVTESCTAHTHDCGYCSACWVKAVQRLFDRSPHGKRLCVFELKFVRQQLACSWRHRYITPFIAYQFVLRKEARQGEAN